MANAGKIRIAKKRCKTQRNTLDSNESLQAWWPGSAETTGGGKRENVGEKKRKLKTLPKNSCLLRPRLEASSAEGIEPDR